VPRGPQGAVGLPTVFAHEKSQRPKSLAYISNTHFPLILYGIDIAGIECSKR